MTADSWPTVPMGQVLTHRKQFVEISDLNTYKRCRVQLHAQGIVLRDIVTGAKIRTKTQQVCRSGEFLVAEIDAKVGGFGVVPESLDGAIVSSHYFLFTLNETALDQRFLDFYIRTPAFRDQVAARGSTNYAAIRPHHVLQYTIPLPTLDEQRRIVARIEALAAKIEDARGLRQQATDDAAALLKSQMRSIFVRLFQTYPPTDVGSLSPHVTSGPRNWAKHYEQDGQRFFRAQDIGPDGSVVNDSKVFVTPPPSQQGRSAGLRVGDLMLVITGATVGRVALYHRDLEPGFVSQHVAICRLPQDQVLPEFALCGLRSPLGQEQLLGRRYGQGKPGLNLGNILSLRLPFPPLTEQRRIVAYLDGLQDHVDALKRLQEETGAELDALLPSVLDRAFKGEL